MVVKDIHVCPVRVLPFNAEAKDAEATRSISDKERMKVSATVRNTRHKRLAPVYVVSGAYTTMNLYTPPPDIVW